MTKLISVIVMLILWFSAAAQGSADESQLINFKVRTNPLDQAVPFSFIGNSRTGMGNETRDDGCFNMLALPGDTLIFRCLGFEDTTWVVNRQDLQLDTITLFVREKNYSLDEINVFMFKSYASFKQKFLSLDVPSEKSMKMSLNINFKELAAIKKAESGTFGYSMPMGGGSWKSTEQRQYDAFMAKRRQYERVDSLTSHTNLMAFTGFEGAKLDSFVLFLRKNYSIDPDLTDYKIMEAVQLAYSDFLAMKK